MVHNKQSKGGIDTICLDCSRAKVKEWRKKNPSKPHGKRHSISSGWRNIIMDFLVKRDGFVCGLCKEPLEGAVLHINHIIPVALGGPDTMENVNLTHASCNLLDGQRVKSEMLKA
jgi:hypothetical protein